MNFIGTLRKIGKRILPLWARDLLRTLFLNFPRKVSRKIKQNRQQHRWEKVQKRFLKYNDKKCYYKPYAEKIKTRGTENPKKKVYIMQPWYDVEGLFSLASTFLRGTRDCIELGYIPVVDMQNFKTPYVTEDEIGRINAWEYYFEQPVNVNLEEAMNSKNVYRIKPYDKYPLNELSYYLDEDGSRTYWRNMAKKYLRIKKEILVVAEKKANEMFGENKKVLGVIARGTDYKVRLASCLQIPPTTETMIAKIKELSQIWASEADKEKIGTRVMSVGGGYTHVYLMTEDAEILEDFKKAFGDKLLYYDKVYIKDYEKSNADHVITYYRENSVNLYQNGYDYLMQTLLMCKCDAMIAAMCGATIGVTFLKDKFEHEYFFDLGRYERDALTYNK